MVPLHCVSLYVWAHHFSLNTIRFDVFRLSNLCELFNEKGTSETRHSVTFTITVHYSSLTIPDSCCRYIFFCALSFSLFLSLSEYSNDIENEWKIFWLSHSRCVSVYVCTWKVCPLCGKLANFPPFSQRCRVVTWEPFSAFNLRMCFWQRHIFFSLVPSIPSFIILDAEKCGSHICTMQWQLKKTRLRFVLFIYGILRQSFCKAFSLLALFWAESLN